MNKAHSPHTLVPANIQWRDDGVPLAPDFGDVYFSRDGGAAESRHVFLHHNRLAERWQALNPNTPGTFTIIETGFGTGLNFLVAWQLWQQSAPPSWRLHYVSVEKHPLRPEDLRRAHRAWPELHQLALILQHNYPPLIPGQHRRMLHNAQVCLELLLGDISDCLPALVAPSVECNHAPLVAADAWFLDGFAPASNPEMWQPSLLACIGLLSRPGTTFATFTAVGAIRRGLQAQGFAVDKVAGFGRKREMLRGSKQAGAQAAAPAPLTAVPWHQPQTQRPPGHIAVIGAGLAGCSTARALAQRGFQVTVIERSAAAASGASGNPQGILYTKLSPEPGSLNQFTLASFLYALAHYGPLLESGAISGERCGVLQLARSDTEQRHYPRLQAQLAQQEWLHFVSAEQASALAGVAIDCAAIYYPTAGWLSPPSVCQHWLDHPNIRLLPHREAVQLQDQQGQWQLLDASGKPLLCADTVVVANSVDAGRLSQCAQLPLKAIRGQLSYLAETALTARPRTVICHEGYLAPPQHGQLCIGASFDLQHQDCLLRDADHQWNMQQLAALSPGLLTADARVLGGRAALRCASPDYHPIVGALPCPTAFDEDYGALRRDARQHIDRPGRYYPNLYINVAHGSRGLTSTPLCAELLASYINNEVRPLARTLCENLSPARFLMRDLKRGRR